MSDDDPFRPTSEGNPFSDIGQQFARAAAKTLDDEIMRLDSEERQYVAVPLDDPRLAEHRAPQRIIQVKGDTPISRTIGDLLQLLAGQPVGSVSEKLIEAAAGVSALQRENALLRMENEDLKLRLRAAGVRLP